ncbi:hypothetical protein ACTA71_002343 [Dictyostelium dimigraforme]
MKACIDIGNERLGCGKEEINLFTFCSILVVKNGQGDSRSNNNGNNGNNKCSNDSKSSDIEVSKVVLATSKVKNKEFNKNVEVKKELKKSKVNLGSPGEELKSKGSLAMDNYQIKKVRNKVSMLDASVGAVHNTKPSRFSASVGADYNNGRVRKGYPNSSRKYK